LRDNKLSTYDFFVFLLSRNDSISGIVLLRDKRAIMLGKIPLWPTQTLC
jgi:hypothetical protein